MRFRLFALAGAAALAWAAPAPAQQYGGGRAGPSMQSPSMQDQSSAAQQVSDQELRQYAAALNGLARFDPDVAVVVERGDAVEVTWIDRGLTREDARRALQEAGLSEEAFRRITRQIHQDPSARQRYRQVAQQMTAQQAAEPSYGAPVARPDQMLPGELDAYVRARQQIERHDPQLAAALQGGRVTVSRGRLESALQGSQVSVEQFARMHQEVQSRPELRAEVESRVGTTQAPGAAAGATAPGTSGAPVTISDEMLRRYVEARREIEPRMTADEFALVHQLVQRDPALRSRVQQQLGAAAPAPGTGAAGTSGAGTPGKSGQDEEIRPGQGAPLPSGGLGIGPAAGTGLTPPDTQQPGLGSGAPTTEQPDGQSGTGNGDGGGLGGGGGGTGGGGTGGGQGGGSSQ